MRHKSNILTPMQVFQQPAFVTTILEKIVSKIPHISM